MNLLLIHNMTQTKHKLHDFNKHLNGILVRKLVPVSVRKGNFKTSTFNKLLNKKYYADHSIEKHTELSEHLQNLVLYYETPEEIEIKDLQKSYFITVGLFIVLLALTAYICVKFF